MKKPPASSALLEKKLSDLKPDARNANKGTARGAQMIKDSLRDYGAGRSILLDKHGQIIAGNKTVEAAGAGGMKDLLVVESDGTRLVAVQRTDLDLNDPRARQLAIADNRSAEVSLEWDTEMLKALSGDGVDLGPFWTGDELEKLLPTSTDLLTDEDDVPEPPAEPKGKLGDLYVLGEHRLLCGDATKRDDVDRLMAGEKADMVFTDPPYGISIVRPHAHGQGRLGGEGGPTPFGGKKGRIRGSKPFGQVGGGGAVAAGWYAPVVGDEDDSAAISGFRLCAELGIPTIIFWGGNYYAYALPPAKCWIVWDKDVSGNFSECEIAYTNLPGRLRLFKHTWSGMLKESERGERRVAPTQKPVALAIWAFAEFGQPKAVLDPFGGSGSTLIACEKTGRRCFMMEISPAYCDVIVARWEAATGKKAVLAGG